MWILNTLFGVRLLKLLNNQRKLPMANNVTLKSLRVMHCNDYNKGRLNTNTHSHDGGDDVASGTGWAGIIEVIHTQHHRIQEPTKRSSCIFHWFFSLLCVCGVWGVGWRVGCGMGEDRCCGVGDRGGVSGHCGVWGWGVRGHEICVHRTC